jgi:N-acetylmuramoyl-L-alanine amidase
MSAPEPPVVQDAEEDFDPGAFLELPAEQQGSNHESPPGETPDSPAPRAEPMPIQAACKRDFKAVRSSGTRSLSQIRLIVIHSTESNSASSSAAWFANPQSQGSAHILVDDNECYRTLDNEIIPWGAPGANTNGFHIEHAGWAVKWDRDDWMRHEQTLRRGAFKAALHARKFGIPLRLLNANDLRNGKAGFVTHATVSDFHPTAGNHRDPGSNFPLELYMQLVQQAAVDV